MKSLVIIFLLIFTTLVLAKENEGGIHTENYCSMINAKTCAHLRFEKWPTSIDTNEFIIHIQTPSNSQITNLSVKLWMEMNGHGHGSSPVKLESIEELNHFLVQEAYFVMPGKWQVILSFIDEGISEKIIIPLEIKE